MAYIPGNTVYLKHSSEKAEIIEVIDKDTIRVKTEDGIEFPIYNSAVMDKPMEQHRVQPEHEKGKAVKCKEKPQIENMYIAWNLHYGDEQVLFEPILVNGDNRLIQLEWSVLYKKDAYYSNTLALPPRHFTKGKKIPSLIMDNRWKISVTGKFIYTDNSTEKYKSEKKIKPGLFKKEAEFDPALSKRVISQELKSSFISVDSSLKKLKEHSKTLKRKPKVDVSENSSYRKVNFSSIDERAGFNDVLDLHLESLTDEPEKYSGKEALDLQLKTLEEYLFTALRFNMKSVFIIHGIGRGTLKKSISKTLRRHPAVRDFRNDHHPRYGFGATEIFFK